jgi:transcriptional regulator with XRE-family HTH domain
VTTAGAAFGRRLRDARERKGIALDTVADSTKIKVSLLASLERGDVTHWPRGIFRRAFIREYAAAIGLQPGPVVAEFTRLFPEDGEAPPLDMRGLDAEMRLTLAADEGWFTRAALLRVAAAAIDAIALVALAAGLAYFAGTAMWAILGIGGLGYYALTTAWLGQSAAHWWLTRGPQRGARRIRRAPAAPAPVADRLQIVSRRESPRRPVPVEPPLDSAADVPPAVAAGH